MAVKNVMHVLEVMEVVEVKAKLTDLSYVKAAEEIAALGKKGCFGKGAGPIELRSGRSTGSARPTCIRRSAPRILHRPGSLIDPEGL
ncbi:hypothetical protein [Streptomyces sp. NPDC002265]|uniref:hypothetical protein n=1 Tax=Streptomyces sp. NPDC002265 TaxID=3154415 RepID=UPI0033326401